MGTRCHTAAESHERMVMLEILVFTVHAASTDRDFKSNKIPHCTAHIEPTTIICIHLRVCERFLKLPLPACPYNLLCKLL